MLTGAVPSIYFALSARARMRLGERVAHPYASACTCRCSHASSRARGTGNAACGMAMPSVPRHLRRMGHARETRHAPPKPHHFRVLDERHLDVTPPSPPQRTEGASGVACAVVRARWYDRSGAWQCMRVEGTAAAAHGTPLRVGGRVFLCCPSAGGAFLHADPWTAAPASRHVVAQWADRGQ